MVQSEQFMNLFKDAAVRLGIQDAGEFASGAVVEVKGVQTWAVFHEVAGDAYLMYEVGVPQPGSAAEVHRQLLELQWVFVGRFDGTFLLANDGIVFSVRTPIHGSLTAEQLADWLVLMADQVLQWRAMFLGGAAIDPVPEQSGAVASPVAQLV